MTNEHEGQETQLSPRSSELRTEFEIARDATSDRAQEIVDLIDQASHDGTKLETETVIRLISSVESLDSRVNRALGLTPEQAGQQVPHDIEQAYQFLKDEEKREPHLDDPIGVRVHPNQPEYTILREHGLSDETIGQGHFRRRDLLNAGFAFLNKLGGGEKSIMSGGFPDPDDPSQTLDFTDRTMLTRAELDKVYRYQQMHPEMFGAQGEDLDEVRKDMLSFIVHASREELIPGDGAFLATLNLSFPKTGTDEDLELVEKFWKTQARDVQAQTGEPNPNLARLAAQSEFARKYCPDLYTMDTPPVYFGQKEARGHQIKAINVRKGKLQGRPSPFLDQGFVYGYNPDIDVYGVPDPAEPSKIRSYRLNAGALHIFGGHPDYPGLSEMGTAAGDQTYMPLGAYIKEFYPKDPAQRQAIQAQENSSFNSEDPYLLSEDAQKRVIVAAKKWKAEQMKYGNLAATRQRLAAAREQIRTSPDEIAQQAKEGNVIAKKVTREQ